MSKKNKSSNGLINFFNSLINSREDWGITVKDPNPSVGVGGYTTGGYTTPFPTYKTVVSPSSLTSLPLPSYGRYASGVGSANTLFNFSVKYCKFDIVNIEDFKNHKLEGMVFNDNIIMTFEDFYNRTKASIDKSESEFPGVSSLNITVKIPCNCFVCEEKARLAESLAEMNDKGNSSGLTDSELQEKLDMIELYKQQASNAMIQPPRMHRMPSSSIPSTHWNGQTIGIGTSGSMWSPVGSASFDVKFDNISRGVREQLPDCQSTYSVNFCIFNNNIEDAFKLVEFIADTHDSNKHLVNPRSYNQDSIDLYIKKYNLEKYSKEYELKYKTNNEAK